MVLRVYFHDYTATSRYTQAEVQGFFGDLDQLWKDTSYGTINVDSQVSTLYQLPDNRSAYIDDHVNGDLSDGNKFGKVLNDAIANSPSGLNWTNLDAVFVVMAETNSAQFHRGQGSSSCNLKMGPGGATANVGCAIFSENPSQNDNQVWGRWAHEMGHAFQQGGPAHPSNYNSAFELMDANYPGQTGVFEKQDGVAFPGWLPATKYQTFEPASGGGIANIWAMEYRPPDRPNIQAVKAEITGGLYYLVSVRRRVLGDDLNGNFTPFGIPDEGVLIERVMEGGNPSLNDCAPTGTCPRWVELMAPPGGNRNDLWKEGELYDGGSDGIYIGVERKIDDDNYRVYIRYDDSALQPDVHVEPWRSPPGNTWETTDIWVDSPVNGYGTYRYGKWNDLSGNPVPRGNGDDPAIGQVNRLYARVRNIGDAPATDVVVHFEITDPPGVGIAGATGWASIGSVDKNDFPTLASIAAGAFADVYIEWTPSFTISPEDLAAGLFAFHTCVRVKVDHVAGETVFANQDGDGEQENIAYFQAATPSPGQPYSEFDGVIRLRNDDLLNRKFFNLSYESDLPETWELDVNRGVLGLYLGPGEVRDIPIMIKPNGAAAVGSVFGVDVMASSMVLLVNDLKPEDQHPEYDPLGGVRVEARVLLKPELRCRAASWGPFEILVQGQLTNFDGFFDPEDPFRVMIEGVDGTRNFLPGTMRVLTVDPDGTFEGWLDTETRVEPNEVVCLFAGTTELASASSGFVPIDGDGDDDAPPLSSVAAGTDVYAFGLDSGSNPWYNRRSGGSWGGWQGLGGKLTGRLSAAATASNDVYVFGLDAGANPWYKHWNGTSWEAWTGLGGKLSSSLSAVAAGSDVYVFGLDSGNSPWYNRRSGGSWGGWQGLGGKLTGSLSAVAAGSDVYVFGLDSGNNPWYNRRSGGSWGGWQGLGGKLSGQLSCAATASNDVYVFGLDAGASPWYKHWNGTSWEAWTGLGGILAP
jgi:hypothetical protein